MNTKALLMERIRQLSVEFTETVRKEGLVDPGQRVCLSGRVYAALKPGAVSYDVDLTLVTKVCQANYKGGRYIRPAEFTSTQVGKLLDRIVYVPAERALTQLLLGRKNAPSDLDPNAVSAINQTLKSPIDGVYYRIGTNADGLRNLWVVEPHSATAGNANQETLVFPVVANEN